MEKKTGISGISMGKNAHKLYYPMKQAIMSILPIVDEFIVVLGDSDEDDLTRKEVESIDSDKIKIIDTVWDIEKFPRGMEHAHQTDIAKNLCSGKWIFYLQSDEVIHEKYLDGIKEKCKKYQDDTEVEGLLFNYVHFWGDYNHYQDNHCWYRKEIRIVKNDPEIHSWESAQSFRRIPKFDGINYRQQEGTYKLKVVEADAAVYHYGWVRPPERMQKKIKAFTTNHKGKADADILEKQHKFDKIFDYGNLSLINEFKGTHPAVMQEWIKAFNWGNKLRYTGPATSQNPIRIKHDKLKYRLISWLEKYLFFNKRLGEFKNYILLKKN
ncbi:MAG: hypothetical protein J7K39_01350 [Bacteroidales bacterium]|nr:hypothetical protein [Bacteroidales bacterium]